MIDQNNITKFDRTTKELQGFLLFAICVAGKKAKAIAPRVSNLLAKLGESPLQELASMGEAEVANQLRSIGIGCYSQKARAVVNAARLDLTNCTICELETVPFIGPKTSRFFILHSRPNQRMAVLDTHILKHLKANGVDNVPKSTPSQRKAYGRLEKAFVELADKAGVSVADYDLAIWKQYSKG